MTRLEELIKELPPEIKQKTAYILEYFLQKRTLQTQSPQKPVPPGPSLENMGNSEFRDKGQRIAMARSELVRVYRREVALAPKGKKMAAKHKFVGAYKLGYYPQLYAILRKTSWQTLERWHLKLRETGDPFDLVPKYGKNQDKTKVTPEQQLCLKDADTPGPSLENMGNSEFSDKGQRIAMARSELVLLYRRKLALAPKGKKMAARHKFVGAYNLGCYPQLYAILQKTSWQTLDRWNLKLRETGKPFDLVPKWGNNQGKTKVTPEQQRCLKDADTPPYERTLSGLVRVAKKIMTAQGVDDTCCVRTYKRFLEKWRKSHRVPGSKPTKQK